MPIYVDNTEIMDEAVHEEMQYHPSSTVEEARYKAGEALVVRQLLLNEALKQKILDPALKNSMQDYDTAMETLLGREVNVPKAEPEMCQRYYEQNQNRFIDKTTGAILPFDLVETHIEEYLQNRSLLAGISQYIKILAGRAKIIGFDMGGEASPLVQ